MLPKGAADDDAVARLGPAARERPPLAHLAEQGDAQRERAVPTVRVAAGEGQVELVGQREHPFVQGHGQVPPAAPRQQQGDHPGQGARGHRGQIAQIDGQGLAAGAPRADLEQLEVDVVGEQVDRENHVVDAGQIQHRRVVARPEAQARVAGQSRAQVSDQVGFHGRQATTNPRRRRPAR